MDPSSARSTSPAPWFRGTRCWSARKSIPTVLSNCSPMKATQSSGAGCWPDCRMSHWTPSWHRPTPRLITRTATIAQATSQLAEARAAQDQAESAFARTRKLRGSGFASQEVLEQRQESALVSAARVASAVQALRMAAADKELAEAKQREMQINSPALKSGHPPPASSSNAMPRSARWHPRTASRCSGSFGTA